MLFLAAERNKLIIIGQLQVLKQRSLHSFRNVLLSEVKQGRPGLLVQFTGFFLAFIRVYRVYVCILSKSISGSPPKTAYEVVSSTIYTDHPGENLAQKHKTIKIDEVGERPAAKHIQIS